jgi:hypothetical protein
MAPTIPVIATIVTFLAHISAGNNLTAAQVKCSLITFALFYHLVSVCHLLQSHEPSYVITVETVVVISPKQYSFITMET